MPSVRPKSKRALVRIVPIVAKAVAVAVAAAIAAACSPRGPLVEPARALGPSAGGARSTVVVDSARGEVVFVAGPFHVPAMSHDEHAKMDMDMVMGGEHEAHAYSPLMYFEWPLDGWYRGFRTSLVDADGRVLPRSLMHHVTGVNFDRRQLLNAEAERFMAAGSETSDHVLPRLLGVPMKGGQKLGIYAAWHNTLGRDFDGVYIRIAMPYVAANALIKPWSAFPVTMDVNDIAGESNAFDVPSGHSERHFEFTMPIGGHFIAAGGHLHDFGSDVRLEDVATRKVLAKLEAIRDTAGHLVAMPTRTFLPLGLRVAAGHRYRVVGEYESSQGTTRPLGGMALMVGLFIPTDPSQWPALDRNDPQMIADLETLPGGPRATAPVIGTIQRTEPSAPGQKQP
jgi:hypothetical protein